MPAVYSGSDDVVQQLNAARRDAVESCTAVEESNVELRAELEDHRDYVRSDLWVFAGLAAGLFFGGFMYREFMW